MARETGRFGKDFRIEYEWRDLEFRARHALKRSSPGRLRQILEFHGADLISHDRASAAVERLAREA